MQEGAIKNVQPAIVQAIHMVDRDAVSDVLEWMSSYNVRSRYDRSGGIMLWTKEGEMFADPGDWIVRDTQGNFYPVKPDIFDQTFKIV